MKASIHFELETAEDFALFGRVFSQAGGFGDAAAVVTPAPAKPAAIEAKAEKPAKPEKPAAKPVAEKPAEKPAEKVEEKDEGDAIVENVDKALVAKELRAFIQAKGETGPKQALSVLKEFGATKFDELKGEDYSKFLSALKKAA